MSLPLLFAGGSTDAPTGAIRWGDGANDFLVWDSPVDGALIWNGIGDGLIWETY